eukprot:scaffold276_cov116-Isochrysis_galbana.AAC.17
MKVQSSGERSAAAGSGPMPALRGLAAVAASDCARWRGVGGDAWPPVDESGLGVRGSSLLDAVGCASGVAGGLGAAAGGRLRVVAGEDTPGVVSRLGSVRSFSADAPDTAARTSGRAEKGRGTAVTCAEHAVRAEHGLAAPRERLSSVVGRALFPDEPDRRLAPRHPRPLRTFEIEHLPRPLLHRQVGEWRAGCPDWPGLARLVSDRQHLYQLARRSSRHLAGHRDAAAAARRRPSARRTPPRSCCHLRWLGLAVSPSTRQRAGRWLRLHQIFWPPALRVVRRDR